MNKYLIAAAVVALVMGATSAKAASADVDSIFNNYRLRL